MDGMRAVAIISVVLFHYGIPFFANGFLGVDIFFVISGYLITSIIYREMVRGEFTYARFYSRRFRRILPALIATVTVTTVVAASLLPPYDLKRYAITAIGALTGLSNFAFFSFVDYFSPKADRQLLLMTWSLGVEEQFYVLFPPTMAFLIGWRKKLLLPIMAGVTVASLIMAVLANHFRPEAAFYLIPFRAWELCVGSLLALAGANGFAQSLPRRLHEALGVVAILLFVIAIGTENGIPTIALNVVIVVGAAMLIVSRESLVNRHILSSGIFVGVGLISYSWYLWHWLPVAVMHVLEIEPSLGGRIAVILSTLIAGMLSYYLVETPFRRGPADHRRVLRRYGVALCVAVFPLCALVATKGLYRFASPQIKSVEDDTLGALKNPCLAKYGEERPRLGLPCVANTKQPAIALIGDSHANALAAGIKSLADARGLAFDQLTKSSCPALFGYTRYMPNHLGHDRECAAFMRSAVSTVRDHPEIKTVVLASYWAASFDEEKDGFRYVPADGDGPRTTLAQSRENLAWGLRQMIAAIRGMGRQVIVLQDVPRFTVDPSTIGLASLIPLRGAITRFAAPDRAGTLVRGDRVALTAIVPDSARPIVRMAVDPRSGVRLLDPVSLLCDSTGCLFRNDNTIFYTDSQHLSNSGARDVASRLPLITIDAR
ncbi:acyltransferase [Sphingomonas sanguinis]|nr:acyltransferase [Sphingomonas sp. LC-1]